jgi:hypothetical protein
MISSSRVSGNESYISKEESPNKDNFLFIFGFRSRCRGWDLCKYGPSVSQVQALIQKRKGKSIKMEF